VNGVLFCGKTDEHIINLLLLIRGEVCKLQTNSADNRLAILVGRQNVLNVDKLAGNLTEEKALKVIEEVNFRHLLAVRASMGQVLQANTGLADITYFTEIT
jgi:hypothetical protein